MSIRSVTWGINGGGFTVKKGIQFMVKAGAAAAACVFLLAGCQFFSTPDKEFSKAGMSITLTSDFAETEVVTQTATYQSKDSVVMALKEEFTLFEELGISSDMTLGEYAELIFQTNAITSTVEEKEGLTCFRYQKEINGKEMTYFAVVEKGSDAYWLFQFSCESKNYEKLEKSFIEWAKTIKI